MKCVKCNGNGRQPVNLYAKVAGEYDYSHTEWRDCDCRPPAPQVALENKHFQDDAELTGVRNVHPDRLTWADGCSFGVELKDPATKWIVWYGYQPGHDRWILWSN